MPATVTHPHPFASKTGHAAPGGRVAAILQVVQLTLAPVLFVTALVTIVFGGGFTRRLVALETTTQRASARVPENQTPGLKIVVIEGEDAVNIVQQKSAVAPVVEVRDRNNQPVSGALVRFAIRNGRATFGGARTLSVTTNAAGRAVATGLTPTGSGALQIGASAVFQGQTTAITIAQTNVMTLAQAGAVSGAGASGGSAGTSTGAGGAAGGGAGGGLSATTVAIVGGAVAGGAIGAKEFLRGGTTYAGRFSGTIAMVFGSCTRVEQNSGTLELEISDDAGALSGSADLQAEVQIVQPNPCGPPGYTRDNFGFDNAAVSGTGNNLTLTASNSNAYTDPDGTSGINSYTYSFVGSQSGAEISGTLTVTRTITNNRGFAPGTGTVTLSVTLR